MALLSLPLQLPSQQQLQQPSRSSSHHHPQLEISISDHPKTHASSSSFTEDLPVLPKVNLPLPSLYVDAVDDEHGGRLFSLCSDEDAERMNSDCDGYDVQHIQHEQVRHKCFSLPIRQHEQHTPGNAQFLQTLCRDGRLERAIDILSHTHTSLPSSIYISLLKACNKKKSLTQAKLVQLHISQYSPNNFDSLLGGYLVVTLAKCGAIEDAFFVSSSLPWRSVFSWTAIISAYVECGKVEEALQTYQYMQEDGIEPNFHTFSSLFKACGSIQDLEQGRKLHSDVHQRGFSSDVYVGSTLVSMYSKCGSMAEAEDVFTTMSQRDIVVWNAMLSGYIEHGLDDRVIQLYRQMQEEDVGVDSYTLMYVLQACTNLAADMKIVSNGVASNVVFFEIGWSVFTNAFKKGFALDDFVCTALLTMLGKCKFIEEAEYIFCTMSPCSIVSWTAMFSAYVEQDRAETALQMFKALQEEGLIPDEQAFAVAFKACTILADKGESRQVITLGIGRALHADACEKGYISDVLVGTALISMYSKCGAIVEAETVFNSLERYDSISWTAMLSAYVEHGFGIKVLHRYEQIRMCMDLDDITLVCMLRGCIETGSLEVCKYLHFDIISLGYDQIGFVSSTLIHAYASCASILDAQAVFDGLSNPNLLSWNACIAGHTGDASIHLYEKMKLACIEPNQSTFTSLLSACSHAGLTDEGVNYFNFMSKDHGVRPNLTHYSIMVGLLARVGDFERVVDILVRMPEQADMTTWLSLLRACQMHGNFQLALQAFDIAVNMQSNHGAPYVLLSNMYADATLEDYTA